MQETKAGAVRLQPDMRYEYDLLGNQVRSGSDNNNSNSLTLALLDRITDTDVAYEKVGADWFKKSLVRNYLTDNNATPTTVQTQKERLNNFATSGAEKAFSESRTLDVNNNQSIFITWVDRAAKKLRQVTDTADSTQDAVSISVNGLLQLSVPSSPRTATTYGYDALGRPLTVTDPATGTTTNSYDAATGRLLSVNDGIQTTTTSYYPNNHANAGRVLSQTNGAGKKIYFDYSVRGEQTRTWGDASYPLEYVYNSFGERTELHTYRAGYNWPGPNWPSLLTGGVDVTMWIYHPATGLLTTKRDAANKDTVYSYDAAGRLLTRTWARLSVASAPIVTTYAYAGNALELSGISYSDGTPNVTFSYDRNSRQKMVTDAAGTRTRTFNAVGATLNETFTAGMLNGIQVTNGYDGFLRRQSLGATMNATSLVSQTYGYDVYGRMGTIASGAQTVTYGYYPTTGLLNTTSYTGGTNLARVYDSFGRLQTITTTPAAGGAISYTYQYDSLSRRNKVTREDGSYWSYGYNDRGELVFGKKYFVDNTPVAGMQFEYGYDNIGNRQATKAGGNDLGTGLRNASYTANNLNQYTQRTVPGAFDVLGTAATGAAVTVNTQATYRKSDYFQKELTVNNAAGPVYQQVDVVGAKNNAGGAGEDAVATQSGKVYVPQATETYAYDLDGNLTQDGRWMYTWDAENRLTSMTAIAAVPVTAKRKLDFAYDYMGRRIEKKVYDWNVGTSAYVLATTTRFVYDGMSLMAEVNSLGIMKKGYIWGNRGLHLIQDNGNIYQVGRDGSKSVVVLVKASSRTIAAQYEYDSYGKSLSEVGEYVSSNVYKYSSEYSDLESGLIYYGFRYYNSDNGRWLSRDPIEEKGGKNLYQFALNAPQLFTDMFGLQVTSPPDSNLALDLQTYFVLTQLRGAIVGTTADYLLTMYLLKVGVAVLSPVQVSRIEASERFRGTVKLAMRRIIFNHGPGQIDYEDKDAKKWLVNFPPAFESLNDVDLFFSFYNLHFGLGLQGCVMGTPGNYKYRGNLNITFSDWFGFSNYTAGGAYVGGRKPFGDYWDDYVKIPFGHPLLTLEEYQLVALQDRGWVKPVDVFGYKNHPFVEASVSEARGDLLVYE